MSEKQEMQFRTQQKLRLKLEEIGDKPLDEQVGSMEKIRTKIKHTTYLIRETRDNDLRRFNCFMYALGMENADPIYKLLSLNPNLNFGSSFVKNLVDTGRIAPNENGKLIIYFDDLGAPTHAGRTERSSRIISKWGTGHIWEHGILEIPIAYGQNYKFYIPTSPHETIEEFQVYLRHCSGTNTDN